MQTNGKDHNRIAIGEISVDLEFLYLAGEEIDMENKEEMLALAAANIEQDILGILEKKLEGFVMKSLSLNGYKKLIDDETYIQSKARLISPELHEDIERLNDLFNRS